MRTVAPPTTGEVHLWQVRLADLPGDDAVLQSPLCEAERARAARFAFSHLTLRWMRARFALRNILARYLDTTPPAVSIGTGEYGKPHLSTATAFEFNLSHCAEHALIAVASGQAVGVDIEAHRAMDDVDRIVERNFSPLERAEYRALASERRLEGFFNGWTRKEAYIKAIGLGLHCPLDSFSVTIDPDAPARLVEIDGDPVKASGWTLRSPPAPDGHVAALVVRGAAVRIVPRRWEELAGD